ncbi:hypothetical protein P7K49_031164, partial [Saguinus oedipus]
QWPRPLPRSRNPAAPSSALQPSVLRNHSLPGVHHNQNESASLNNKNVSSEKRTENCNFLFLPLEVTRRSSVPCESQKEYVPPKNLAKAMKVTFQTPLRDPQKHRILSPSTASKLEAPLAQGNTLSQNSHLEWTQKENQQLIKAVDAKTTHGIIQKPVEADTDPLGDAGSTFGDGSSGEPGPGALADLDCSSSRQSPGSSENQMLSPGKLSGSPEQALEENVSGTQTLEAASAQMASSSRTGPIKLECDFSDGATSKRAPPPKRQGERSGLKPPLRRAAARQQQAPRVLEEDGGSGGEEPPELASHGSFHFDWDKLKYPNFTPFGGGTKSGCREAQPPESPKTRLGRLAAEPRSPTEEPGSHLSQQLLSALAEDTPVVQLAAETPGAELCWHLASHRLSGRPQRPGPGATETSSMHDVEEPPSGSLREATVVELDFLGALDAPVPDPPPDVPAPGGPPLSTGPIVDLLQYGQKDLDTAVKATQRRTRS